MERHAHAPYDSWTACVNKRMADFYDGGVAALALLWLCSALEDKNNMRALLYISAPYVAAENSGSCIARKQQHLGVAMAGLRHAMKSSRESNGGRRAKMWPGSANVGSPGARRWRGWLAVVDGG